MFVGRAKFRRSDFSFPRQHGFAKRHQHSVPVVLARTGTVVAVVRHSILLEPIPLTHSAAGGAKRVGWQSSSMTAVNSGIGKD